MVPEMQKAKGEAGEEWTGVRNYQARNNMRAMKIGDKGFSTTRMKGLMSSASWRSAPFRTRIRPQRAI